MKKCFKQIAAATLSAAMVMAPSLNVLAANPTQGAGTGNILAYSLTSVVVPTDFKVALNPMGLDVTVRDSDTVDDTIVSLNYGIGNLSTSDMVVDLTLKVSSSAESGITFVESAEALADAEAGDLSMYLAIVKNDGAVKTAGDEAFAVTDGESNVTAADLCDVKMTAKADTAVVFTASENEDNTVVSEQKFELTKSTYAVKDGETVDFNTTQETLASKMEISALGTNSVLGFTIIGDMNSDADWTKANVTTLTFTPTYEIRTALEEAAALEEANATITATPASLNASTATATITHIPAGATLTDVAYVKADGSNANVTSGTHYSWNAETGEFTVLKTALIGESYVGAKWVLTFGTDTTIEIPIVAE